MRREAPENFELLGLPPHSFRGGRAGGFPSGLLPSLGGMFSRVIDMVWVSVKGR